MIGQEEGRHLAGPRSALNAGLGENERLDGRYLFGQEHADPRRSIHIRELDLARVQTLVFEEAGDDLGSGASRPTRDLKTLKLFWLGDICAGRKGIDRIR